MCKSEFLDLEILVKHFKFIHLLGSYDTYACYEFNCFQYFTNLSSFKKHAKLKHFSLDISMNSDINNVANNSVNKIKPLDFDIATDSSNFKSSDRTFHTDKTSHTKSVEIFQSTIIDFLFLSFFKCLTKKTSL